MGVLVRIERQKAFLRRGEWSCADSRLESRLNETTRAWIQETGGPPLDSSDLEHAVAQEMAKRFRGRVVSKAKSSAVLQRRIYLSQRQMELNFDPRP
ncbi:MAG TPA: hypothetical protein DEH78_14430 [Solibacterales bacterium]|nr:hypothetical protein [Bryobacterales bacterium]